MNWQGFLPSTGAGPANSTAPVAEWQQFVPAGFGASAPAAGAQDETAKATDARVQVGGATDAGAEAADSAAARAKAAAAAKDLARVKRDVAAEAAAKDQAEKATKAAEAAAGGAPSAAVVDLVGTSQVGNSLVFFVFIGSVAGTVAFLLLRAVAGTRLCAVEADGQYVSLL